MKKIKEEQLEKLQTFVNAINQLQTTIGGVELQKQELTAQAISINKELRDFQEELRKEYGEITVNVKTGEITDADYKED
jgi:Asp-tRNA(Asn)/Glu-tRNA(Gln) amidotransferase C subunit